MRSARGKDVGDDDDGEKKLSTVIGLFLGPSRPQLDVDCQWPLDVRRPRRAAPARADLLQRYASRTWDGHGTTRGAAAAAELKGRAARPRPSTTGALPAVAPRVGHAAGAAFEPALRPPAQQHGGGGGLALVYRRTRNAARRQTPAALKLQEKARHFVARESALRESIEGDEARVRVWYVGFIDSMLQREIHLTHVIPLLEEKETEEREAMEAEEQRHLQVVRRRRKIELLIVFDALRKQQVQDAWDLIYYSMAPSVRELSKSEGRGRKAIAASEARAANILQVRLHKLTTLLLEWPEVVPALKASGRELHDQYAFRYPPSVYNNG
ncbi:hypothetical protein DIPPA_33295 [Diplonema papillatum]|nr:hypothetical protein DIPPA_33295 [Diplonema papillatum]